MSKQEPIWGVDVHPEFQRGLRFQQVKREGYDFAIVKASEGPYRDGTTYVPSGFADYFRRVEAAGLIPGVYAFLLSTPAKAQADHFLRTIEKVGGPEGKILAVDFEAYPGFPVLTPGNEQLETFISELRRRVGEHPIVLYSGRSFWNGGNPSGSFDQYGADVAWDASYLDFAVDLGSSLYYRALDVGLGWGQRWGGVEPRFWQFASTARVAGMNIDANAFRGSMRHLRALTAGKPVPEPTGDEVQLRRGLGKDGNPAVNYVRQHPTNYAWRADVELWTHELANDPEFKGKVWINTYKCHPPGITGAEPWRCRDTTSFDVWGFRGRGYPIGTALGNRMFERIFNDPDPPNIWWTIWNGRMWTRSGGWDASPPGPPDSDPQHLGHIHCTVLD